MQSPQFEIRYYDAGDHLLGGEWFHERVFALGRAAELAGDVLVHSVLVLEAGAVVRQWNRSLAA